MIMRLCGILDTIHQSAVESDPLKENRRRELGFDLDVMT